MKARDWTIGGTTVLCAAAAIAATLATQRSNLHHAAATAAGAARLVAFTGRSAAQRADPALARLDAALAALARHAPLARPGHMSEDLHAMNPAARFRAAPAAGGAALVLIDAATRGDPGELMAALVREGLQHPAVYANDVGGWLPVDALAAASALPQVAAMHAAMSRPRAAGSVSTQGDWAQRSSALRTRWPTLTGAGVKVGVLSDSFDCYAVYAQPGSGVPAAGFSGYAYNGFTATAADDEASGALPAGVTVLEEPYASNPPAAGNCLDYPKPDRGRSRTRDGRCCRSCTRSHRGRA